MTIKQLSAILCENESTVRKKYGKMFPEWGSKVKGKWNLDYFKVRTDLWSNTDLDLFQALSPVLKRQMAAFNRIHNFSISFDPYYVIIEHNVKSIVINISITENFRITIVINSRANEISEIFPNEDTWNDLIKGEKSIIAEIIEELKDITGV